MASSDRPSSRYSPFLFAFSLRARVLHARLHVLTMPHGEHVSVTETCPNFLPFPSKYCMLCACLHRSCSMPRSCAHFACTRARRYAMCAGVCAQAFRFQGDQKMPGRYALKTVHFGTTSQKNLSAYKPVREPCFRAHASAWRCTFFIFFNEVRLGCCARYAIHASKCFVGVLAHP